jgi:hypothetical protein
MIRQTVAHVDLHAIRSNFRAVRPFSAPHAGGGRARRDRRRQGQRLRARRRRGRARPRGAGAAMLACADIEEAVALREAGVRAPDARLRRPERQRPRGRLRARLTPTISTPGAARRAAARRRAPRRAPRLPPEDRHRHEPARLPPRQPRADAARGGAPARTSTSRRSTRTSPRPTIPIIRHFGEQRERFEAVLASLPRSASRPSGMRPTAPRCCATSASGTTTSARACCSTASCRRRSRRPSRCDLPCHCAAVSWRSRGCARRGRRLRPRAHGRRPRTLAIVPAGYADGLDVRLAGRGFMLVRGRPDAGRRLGVHGHA